MMTKEEMRIAIAEKCGFTKQPEWYHWWRMPDGKEIFSDNLPNYPDDLNAMHEAEKVLGTTGNWLSYVHELSSLLRRDGNRLSIEEARNGGQIDYWAIGLTRATAAQRAEAFCRVFWPEKFND